jgi:hypothetical protein
MERLHLRPIQDMRTGKPMDMLVCSKGDTATAHLTENGYVRHRMLEIEVRLGLTEVGLLPNVA